MHKKTKDNTQRISHIDSDDFGEIIECRQLGGYQLWEVRSCLRQLLVRRFLYHKKGTTVTDAELIEMIRTGDLHWGYAMLKARHMPKLLGYCEAITKGIGIFGEDLAEDTFKKFVFFIRRRHDAVIHNVIGLLKRTARNSLIKYKNQHKQIAMIIEQSYTRDTYDFGDSGLEVDALINCQTLIKQERLALCLRFGYGLDVNRLARILDTTVQTVYVSISTGRKKLKDYRDLS